MKNLIFSVFGCFRTVSAMCRDRQEFSHHNHIKYHRLRRGKDTQIAGEDSLVERKRAIRNSTDKNRKDRRSSRPSDVKRHTGSKKNFREKGAVENAEIGTGVVRAGVRRTAANAG